MTGKTIQSKTGVRKLHKESQSKHENRPKLAFLLQDWGDAYNVGGMFRVADACGAHELVMCGKTPVPPNPMIGVTSLGHHRRVAWRQIERYDDAARQLVEEGWHLVAVEIAEGAIEYRDYPYPDKVCLVLGNEGAGVYASVLKHCSGAVYIPMLGKGRSMNVHVSAAVVGYHIALSERP